MRQIKIGKSITSRESASLDKYLQEIGRVPLITAEEEVELAKKIKADDQKALEQLVKANLRFVVSVAKQYQNQGLSLPDLINEGNLGLIKAAKRFDETRGFKFISYGVWWIRQSISQALAEQSRIVRLPLNKIGAKNKVWNKITRLEQALERDPSTEEISEALSLSPEVVDLAIMHNQKDASFDFQFETEEGDPTTRYDSMEDKDAVKPDKFLMTDSLREEIARSLSKLTCREANVIRMYFGLSGKAMTLEEIGASFGLTRERVRQIKDKAIRRLKHPGRSKLLKTYLD